MSSDKGPKHILTKNINIEKVKTSKNDKRTVWILSASSIHVLTDRNWLEILDPMTQKASKISDCFVKNPVQLKLYMFPKLSSNNMWEFIWYLTLWSIWTGFLIDYCILIDQLTSTILHAPRRIKQENWDMTSWLPEVDIFCIIDTGAEWIPILVTLFLLGVISAGSVVKLVLVMVTSCSGESSYSSSQDASNLFDSLKVEVSSFIKSISI